MPAHPQIAALSPLLENCRSAAECASTVSGLLRDLEAEAEELLAEEGAAAPVRVELGREYYPTRDYGELSYPAGEYDSLRVYIGEGAGENWWCVVFPPLCLNSSAAAGDPAPGYTESESDTLKKEGSGEVRFFILDLIARVKRWFE